MNNNSKSSVGFVKPQKVIFQDPIQLECGRKLDQIEVVYEAYGELNEKKDNAILICHALSGNHHAAGFYKESDSRPGWWDVPRKPVAGRVDAQYRFCSGRSR